MQSNIDPEELFRQIFGDFKNFRSSGGRSGFGFGTIFDDLAGFGFGPQAHEASISLTFKEAAKGAVKEIEMYVGGTARSERTTSC